jgi:hypothetical protein
MISGYPKRLAAWLGLIAIWLIVAAPTVSRMIFLPQALVVPICSVAAEGQHAVVLHIRTDGQGGHPANPLDVCSYCGVFAHSTATPLMPPMVPAVLLLALVSLVVPRNNRFRPHAVFPSGHPRDPPYRF